MAKTGKGRASGAVKSGLAAAAKKITKTVTKAVTPKATKKSAEKTPSSPVSTSSSLSDLRDKLLSGTSATKKIDPYGLLPSNLTSLGGSSSKTSSNAADSIINPQMPPRGNQERNREADIAAWNRSKGSPESEQIATALTPKDNLLIDNGSFIDNAESGAVVGPVDINKAKNNVAFITGNWDHISDEDKGDAAIYLAYTAGLNDQTKDILLPYYSTLTGDKKYKLLNAMLYSSGISKETQALLNSLSTKEQKAFIDMATPDPTSTKGFQLAGDYANIKAQKQTEWEKEWAKENYSWFDALKDTAVHGVATAGASLMDSVSFLAADFLQNKDKLNNFVSILDGTKEIEAQDAESLLDAAKIGGTELLRVLGNVAYDILNFAEIGPKVLLDPVIDDEWANKAAEKLLSLTEGYYKERGLYELHMDASSLPGAVKSTAKVVNFVAQMLPSIALAATGAGAPGAAASASRAGLALFGTQAGGQAARQAYESGADLKDAIAYGVMSGAAEVATAKMFTGFGYFGKGAFSGLGKRAGAEMLETTAQKSIFTPKTVDLLKNFKSSPYGHALTYFVNAGAEATEEMTGQVLQAYLQRATYDPNAQNATLKEIVAAGGYGFVVASILGLPAAKLGITGSVDRGTDGGSTAIDVRTNGGVTNDAVGKGISLNPLGVASSGQIGNIEQQLKTGKITPAEAQYAADGVPNGGVANAAAGKKGVPDLVGMASSGQEAIDKLRDMAIGRKEGDKISVAFQRDGKTVVYDASVNAYGKLGLVFQREATPKEAAALQGKFDARSAVANESGPIGVPGDALGKANNELQTPLTSRKSDGTLKLADSYGEPTEIRQEASTGKMLSVGSAGKTDPLSNPKIAKEIETDPQALYGYSPKKDSPLKKFNVDWTNPNEVSTARTARIEYLKKLDLKKAELTKEVSQLQSTGKSFEEIARIKVEQRNMERIQSYINSNNLEGLKAMKERNILEYGREEGPTPEQLFKKYGSWEDVIFGSTKSSSAMDVLTGLYKE